MKSIIEQIQEDDPSYDPLRDALKESGVTRDLWNAAVDRVYIDGMYGPISSSQWEDEDGRNPYSVSEARTIIALVLNSVVGYIDHDYDDNEVLVVEADEIKKALVPWYSKIYGVAYPITEDFDPKYNKIYRVSQ